MKNQMRKNKRMAKNDNFMDIKFAEVAWTPTDVKSLRPSFTDQQCFDAMMKVEKQLRDRSIEEGWTILKDLLDFSFPEN